MTVCLCAIKIALRTGVMENKIIAAGKTTCEAAVREKKASLPVTGMGYASCAQSVESMIGTQPEVSLATVNFASQKLHEFYDLNKVTLPDIQRNVLLIKLHRTPLRQQYTTRAGSRSIHVHQ